jgi:uncharacterized protein YvpB
MAFTITIIICGFGAISSFSEYIPGGITAVLAQEVSTDDGVAIDASNDVPTLDIQMNFVEREAGKIIPEQLVDNTKESLQDLGAIENVVDTFERMDDRQSSVQVEGPELPHTQVVTESPLEPIVQLPMEDDYHSQIYETSLPNACGPTSILMVLDYMGIEDSLEEVINSQDILPENGGYDAYCSANVVCMSPGALAQFASQRYGLQVEAREGWTFEEIHQSLAEGHPIIADIIWRLADVGPGHFVVIYGVDVSTEQIYYHDPYDGAEMVADWEDFANAWEGPIDVGDPLQPQGHHFWGMEILAD